ncbi:PREDICTED: WD repeat-containing protein 5B-like [Nelumbo nucifera]|uniref:Myosin heavy chain kinase B-like n=2 Tax=Nelumbo nucifera TaxID=4432 RepID=A0A822YN52_NELNU|nr:PREDICTED: WD repeat-containing protein 5B-like [Nelumbo nucifera]DAD35604.1 TPA_asm: hypothetical protein HUJ06_006244 [Nelumbo nucifera]
MEFYSGTHESFFDEEQNTPKSPTPLSFKTHHQLNISEIDKECSSPRPLSPIDQLPPQSPESPWTLSPLHPSPSLLFQCLTSLYRHDGNIFSIAVLRDLVFTGSESSRIRVWRKPECMERGYIKAKSGEVRALSAYANMLFSTHRDHRIRVWSISLSDKFRSKKITSLPRRNSFLLFPRSKFQQHHKDCISCLAYYHAEGILYTGSWDKTVKAWRMSDRKCVDSFMAHEDHINGIVVNQEDGCVFTCSSDGSVKIWRRVFGESSHTLTMTLKFQLSPVNALALSRSPDASFLYSGSSDGFINVWEKEKVSGRFNHGGFLHGHRFSVLCLEAIDGLVLSGSEDTTVRVWKREEGTSFHACLAVLDGHRGPVKCLAACLEMDTLAMGFLVHTASLDGTFKIWRVKVFSSETKLTMKLDDADTNDQKKKRAEYEICPVLSPAWVEKKRQG